MIICMMLNMLEGRILSRDFIGEKRFIFYIKFNMSLENFLYIIIRLQFLICLYFNIIINKLQG